MPPAIAAVALRIMDRVRKARLSCAWVGLRRESTGAVVHSESGGSGSEMVPPGNEPVIGCRDEQADL